MRGAALRWTAGPLAVVGMLLILTSKASNISNAGTSASAVQITQLDAGSVFYAVILLGICVGLSITSSAGE